jgi:DNA polymerase-3 subunit delta
MKWVNVMNQVYLFCGTEELIIKNKMDKVIKSHHGNEDNMIIYDMDEINVGMAMQDAITMPFITDKKLIILKNPTFLSTQKGDLSHDIPTLMDYLDHPLATTVLIIDATNIKLDERKEVVKKLLKVAEVSETKELTPIEEEGWLKRQFALEGIEIRDDVVKLFFNRLGRNLLNAKNEVNKLINYVNGRKIITAKDVNEVVTKELEQEIFAISNAILEKNKEKTITTYQELIKSGKDATQLISMVARSMMDNLAISHLIAAQYSQNDIASTLGVSSGRAYYMIKNAKVFHSDLIKDHIQKLADLDYKIKTGQIEATTGLELFLFGL